MTGADIVAALMLADPALVAFVPATAIKLGRLPDGIALPAFLIRTTSSIDRQPLKRPAIVRVTDRVSVTVRAASYRDQVAAIRLVRACCAGRTGDIGGGSRVSILTAGKGPDLNGPADSFEQTQDFRVSFDAAVCNPQETTMADEKTIHGKAVRNFRDAGTEKLFQQGKTYAFGAGAFANYEHARLIMLADAESATSEPLPAPALPSDPA